MILYGSQALRIGLEKAGVYDCRRSLISDIDILASAAEAREFTFEAKMKLIKSSPERSMWKAPEGEIVEIEYITPGTSNSLYFLWAETMAKLESYPFYGFELEVAPLEMLFSIKKAHRHSPRMFEKHVRDYNQLRILFGGKDTFPKITAMRYQETKEREKLRTPSLNKTATEFFDDLVSNRTFIHDQIHEVMAFGERPMFEKIKVDPNLVACSKEKFFALTPTQRRQCVQEEAYVIALERAMIPMLFEGEKIANPYEAYKWAVMRICTTLCSGWFREYALENYDQIMFWYDSNYVEKFLKAVEEGRIKRIEK